MESRALLAKPWVRIVLFLWGILFPIVFVALPLLKVATGEAAFTMQPVWAFAFWVLTPAAVAIVWKRFGPQAETENDT